MKTMKFLKTDFFKKICGKVSDFTVKSTVGFKPIDTIDIDESIYFLGFRLKHKVVKGISVNDINVIRAIKDFQKKDESKSKRVIVKGFKTKKGD